MATKAIPSKVLDQRAAKQSAIMATAFAAAMVSALQPTLQALADDKEDRHELAQKMQIAIDKSHEALELAKVNEREITHNKERMTALLGDGTGENGKLARMDDKLGSVENDVKTLLQNFADIKAQNADLRTRAEKSQTFMDGWRGVALALGVLGAVVAIIFHFVPGK